MKSPGGEELKNILSDEDKKVGEARGVLSRIFRKVLGDLNVTPAKWNSLMNAYLTNPRNRVPRNSRGRSSVRGNLNKELRKEDMTWSNFEKGIRFLNPVRASFVIKLEWRSGRTTVHEVQILGDPKQPSGEEKEGEE